MSMCRVVANQNSILEEISQSVLKEINWIFIGRTDAEAEAPILWPPIAKSRLIGKVSDVRKDWGQEKRGCDRGWDGWMTSLTQWTWVWANSRRQWRTGKCVLLSMRSQRVGHDLATEHHHQISPLSSWAKGLIGLIGASDQPRPIRLSLERMLRARREKSTFYRGFWKCNSESPGLLQLIFWKKLSTDWI